MTIPLFPLGAVLFPTELMPLHIFEERYLEMVNGCLDKENPFGIVCHDGDEMASVGCTARIRKVLQRYADGRLDIVVSGERRFEISEVYDDRAYLRCDFQELPDVGIAANPDAVDRVIAQHMRLLEIVNRNIRPSMYHKNSSVSYQIASMAGLSLEQQQSVLEIRSERQRVAFLIRHFEAFIPQVEKNQALRTKIQSNGYLERGDW